MSEFKVDVAHFKMIAEFYNRKCPCWGQQHSCPCPPFVESGVCRCGAVRTLDDAKAQTPKYEMYKVDFNLLSKVVEKGHKCPSDSDTTCFCHEFLETGSCKLGMFRKR